MNEIFDNINNNNNINDDDKLWNIYIWRINFHSAMLTGQFDKDRLGESRKPQTYTFFSATKYQL